MAVIQLAQAQLESNNPSGLVIYHDLETKLNAMIAGRHGPTVIGRARHTDELTKQSLSSSSRGGAVKP